MNIIHFIVTQAAQIKKPQKLLAFEASLSLKQSYLSKIIFLTELKLPAFIL